MAVREKKRSENKLKLGRDILVKIFKRNKLIKMQDLQEDMVAS